MKKINKTKDIEFDPDQLAEMLLQSFGKSEIEKEVNKVDFTKYQWKPELFCKEQLDMIITPDMHRLMESIVKYKITIAQSSNAVGKSHLAGALAVWFYKSFPGSQVLTMASPPERQLREGLWAKIRTFIRQNPSLVEGEKVNTLKITPTNSKYAEEDKTLESCIIGITIPSAGDAEQQATSVSGLHAPYQMAICDEADGVPSGVFKGLEGVISGNNSRLLLLFNPKIRSGYVYQLIKNGLANVVTMSAFDHPNVQTGEDIIPGAVSRDKTVQRINDMTRPIRLGEIPDETTCFEVPDFLVGATTVSGSGQKYPPLPAGWRRIDEPAFSYIVLGRFPAMGSNQLISQEWIDAARSRWDLYTAKFGNKPPIGIRPLLGMDVADEGVDWNTVCASYGNYIAPLEKWRGMDVDLSATRASSYYAELRAYQINVESDGLGASVAPKMGRNGYWFCPQCESTFFNDKIFECPDCKTESGKPVEMIREHINSRKIIVGEKSSKKCELGYFGCLRDQLWWEVREWLRKDQAMLPPDQDLIEELLVVTYGVVEGKIKVMPAKIIREKLGRSADSASALIQTRYTGSGRPKVSNLLD